jgi:ATPase subunit of ABC transporter with duplicated ATPase domains
VPGARTADPTVPHLSPAPGDIASGAHGAAGRIDGSPGVAGTPPGKGLRRVISVKDLGIRMGARELMSDVTFSVDRGDRIGLVGRNGAGKTTLMKTLLGQRQPTEGSVSLSGEIGYLMQDTQTGADDAIVIEHILSVRGLDALLRKLHRAEEQMASETISDKDRAKAMDRYVRLDAELEAAGGYAAEAEARRMAANLKLEDRLLNQELSTLSGGQRRRVELVRVLFGRSDMMLLDEPTNHLDADSIRWLREHLATFEGGLVIISHDIDLVGEVVNKVFYLDANRGVIDQYNMGWDKYLKQRSADEARRTRERQNAQKKASALQVQADKMRAKATKAVAAQNMAKRAERLLAGVEEERRTDRVANLRFPTPAPCGRTPLKAEGLARSYGSLEIFSGVDLAIDRGSRVVILGLNGAGKTTLLRILAGVDEPDAGELVPGHGLKVGYYAQEHETLDPDLTVFQNMMRAATQISDLEARKILGSFLFSGDDAFKPAGVLSGGEKTRLALAMLVVSSANVLLLDEPTNNLDPASREEILDALRRFEGAIILVSHDPGAVEALNPERVLLMPDGDEDLWNQSYLELIQLA